MDTQSCSMASIFSAIVMVSTGIFMLVFSPHIVTRVAPDEIYLALFLKVNPWDDEGREVFEQTKLERILWLKQMIKAQQPNLSDEQAYPHCAP